MEKAKEKVIVTGDSKQIDLLIREGKVKIARGLLTFKKADTNKVPKDTKTVEQK
jgi:hypothetical protein